ncbi:MAG: Clp protease N-terminal domain-containing protein [Candidatus Acidiferrales bacterium]
MFERYTEQARRAIFFARCEAVRFGKQEIEVTHLLHGLAYEWPELKQKLELALVDSWADELERLRERPLTREIPIGESVKKVFRYAIEFSEAEGSDWITTAHLLRGVARCDPGSAELLGQAGISPQQISSPDSKRS